MKNFLLLAWKSTFGDVGAGNGYTCRIAEIKTSSKLRNRAR